MLILSIQDYPNIFCAYEQKHEFDTIEKIDILDCNAGDHSHPFATNFNPEINICEVTQQARHWREGKWIESPAILLMTVSISPLTILKGESYLLYHEEMESLVENIRGLKQIRFWMTFGSSYITHLKVLENVCITRIDEVEFEGQKIVPIRCLKKYLLPVLLV